MLTGIIQSQFEDFEGFILYMLYFYLSDPEEFVVLLFEKVLQVDPFITLQMDDTVNTSHLYQLFPPAEKRNTLPSIQFLLELSLLNGNLKLKEVSANSF